MSVSGEAFDRPLPSELAAVAEAAGSRLRAEVVADPDQEDAARQELLGAATTAISAKYSLTEIAQAEARGKERVRRELRADALRRVERTARQAREAEAEHRRAIGRAIRLGLSMREIASAAGVTHGTIRAIGHRLVADGVTSNIPADQPPETHGEFAAEGDRSAEMAHTEGAPFQA